MIYVCRVCNKQMKKFDAIIYKCEADDHRTTIVITYKTHTPSVETVKIWNPNAETQHYMFEFYFEDNCTQITRVLKGSLSETQIPFYKEEGIMEIDFSDMNAVYEKLETMDTFS